MKRGALSSWPLFVLLALALQPGAALACATCFGASDSELAQGMNMGILSLLVIIISVLVGVASFFVFLAKRSISVENTESKPEPMKS